MANSSPRPIQVNFSELFRAFLPAFLRRSQSALGRAMRAPLGSPPFPTRPARGDSTMLNSQPSTPRDIRRPCVLPSAIASNRSNLAPPLKTLTTSRLLTHSPLSPYNNISRLPLLLLLRSHQKCLVRIERNSMPLSSFHSRIAPQIEIQIRIANALIVIRPAPFRLARPRRDAGLKTRL